MASTKRENPKEEKREAKKAKLTLSDSQSEFKKQCVKLNPADCDLDFNIEANGLHGSGLYEQGFAYCWSGARANVGIKGGKYIFGCKIISAQPVDMEDNSSDQHLCRVGISRGDDSVGSLGETTNSFGFGGTGKFSNAGKFSNYGERFGVGDTIVCAVNIESKPFASVGFSKNGKWLGIAKEFDVGTMGLNSPVEQRSLEYAIFPHVLLKNVVVELQFSVEDGLILEEGYKPWDCAYEDGNGIMGPVFSDTGDCEVLMMVGLPASGKTTWAEKWVNEHPEKRYILLGTNLALDRMKVTGLLRKQNYSERFDRLMNRATGIFNTLLTRASKTPRNFIIDQTNVYKNARKRKLKPFFEYRKVAVVIFPKPDEVKLRAETRFKEMGKEVPAEAVNEMLANYVLPTSTDMLGSDEHFDEVWFPELNRGESQRFLEEMKRALGSLTSSPHSSKSSIQSYASPLTQNGRDLLDTGGQWQKTDSPLHRAACDYPRPQQVSSSYPSDGLQGQSQYVFGGYQSQSGTDSYGYGGLDQNRMFNPENRSPVPGGGAGGPEPYQSHGGVSPYGIPNYGSRIHSTGSNTRHHWSHGGVDPYIRPNYEHPSTFGSSSGSPRTPYSYNSLGNPRFASQMPSEPAFDPHGAFSTPYGTPYGTPPPRLLYGTPPPAAGRQQYEGFFPPPGQRFY